MVKHGSNNKARRKQSRVAHMTVEGAAFGVRARFTLQKGPVAKSEGRVREKKTRGTTRGAKRGQAKGER